MCCCRAPDHPSSKDSLRNEEAPRPWEVQRNFWMDRDPACRLRDKSYLTGNTGTVAYSRISRNPSNHCLDREACFSDSCPVLTRVYVPLSSVRTSRHKMKVYIALIIILYSYYITVELPPLTWNVSSLVGNIRSWPRIM